MPIRFSAPSSSVTIGPTAIDLFCGCGGLTEGLKQAGFRVIGAVDNDRLSVETYEINHPESHVWLMDIRNLSAQRVMRLLRLRKGQLGLLAGCPPCQGFSSIRTRNRSRRIYDREQKDLVFQFLRFVRVMRPKAVMMENVPGLQADRRMSVLRSALKRLGYACHDRVLNTADYGVPQRRRRMILLGGRFGPIAFADPTGRRSTVRSAIGDLPNPGRSKDSLHVCNERRSPRIAALISSIPIDGGSRGDLDARFQLACHRKCDGFKDVYGRMAWDKVAPTITGGCLNPSKGRFLHPEQNRAITLREAALLQSFPRRYFFPTERGRYPVATLIGNALPPQFIKCHAGRVREYLDVVI